MGYIQDTLGFSESAFVLLRDLIHERTGMFYENGRRDMLANKLSALVVEAGLESFLDYYYLLKYDTRAADEWERVLDALAVPETYFWREPEQLRALVDVLVPQHFARPRAGPLRIWSAACATGEEPLSIALALEEAGWFARAPIEIVASDGSQALLARARRGLYRERSFRNLPPQLWARYFTRVPEGWCVQPDLHARVAWRQANLAMEGEVLSLAAADVVFCRNVFIYFSDRMVGRVASWFYRAMPAPGYLFLGVSESLMRTAVPFELQELGTAFVYVKRRRAA